ATASRPRRQAARGAAGARACPARRRAAAAIAHCRRPAPPRTRPAPRAAPRALLSRPRRRPARPSRRSRTRRARGKASATQSSVVPARLLFVIVVQQEQDLVESVVEHLPIRPARVPAVVEHAVQTDDHAGAILAVLAMDQDG